MIEALRQKRQNRVTWIENQNPPGEADRFTMVDVVDHVLVFRL